MIFYFFLLFLLLGSTLVFYSSSPYYSALGLVISSMFGCVVLGFCGISFLAMLLLLVYMGGMLVVFIYSSALSADRFPTINNFWEVLIIFFLCSLWVFFVFEDFLLLGVVTGFLGLQDLICLGELYNYGWLYLLVGGLVLLVVLIVALVVSYGFSNLALRAL
uniref:NADH-ubiquinone oxidoreductase chain 6 n=1 Tax=Cercodemas anceps TaxID=2785214 RepID=A0A7S8FJ98_9ECHN|nr:NADH dehydrogenase subunit 6 [Cercodemas anceps]QPD06746.1 NADH dehydrogenase subunit 6 [Cercodemas anceps]